MPTSGRPRSAAAEGGIGEAARGKLRPVTGDDIDKAVKKLSKSVSSTGREITKVYDWNKEYGEIKTKPKVASMSMYL